MASGDFDCTCLPTRIASRRRCSPENPYISIRKVVSLMENPLSAEEYDRQLMILNDFIDASTYAYWVRDLPYIMRLLELLIKLQDTVCLFEDPLRLLLCLCGVPPMLIRTSDANTYSRDIQEYFSFLGYLLIQLQDEQLQDLVFRALHELLQRKAPVGICCVTLKTCYSAVEESQLPKIVTQLMEIADDNLYIKLLNNALILVNISPIVCQKMVSENIINHLLVRLEPSWKTRNKDLPPPDPDAECTIQNLEITSKLLWTLLSALKNESNEFKKSIEPPSLQAIWSLRYALQVLIKRNGSELIRNHLMGILVQCINIFPAIVTIKSGLARDLAILSTATEIGAGGTWAAQVRFTSNELDYDFKKMSLLAVCYCAKHVIPIQILLPKRMIPALLKIISPELNAMWHPQQHSKLMSYALYALEIIGERIPSEFLYYDGPLKMLMLIDYYNVEPYDLHLLQACLKSLHAISSMEDENIMENLLLHDTNTVLQVLCETALLPTKIYTLAIQQCLAYTFSTFELLYKTEEVCESSAVQLCTKIMKRVIIRPSEDPVYDPKFLICVLGFFWEGVVWCESNLKLFVSSGGVFTFLDFLQKTPFPVKTVALGALVDMCNEGTCIPHLITWRRNGQTLLPMLLKLFRDENLKIGVKTTNKGTIADIEAPLMGYQQWHETFYEYKDPNSSPATVDLLGSCRPKIYALIQLLNNRHEIRADIANEHYCMYDNNNLNTLDQMTLLLAENFLALKLGEAWVELNKDMEKQGIRPLAIDGEMVALLTHRLHKWTLHIKTLQEGLLHKRKQKDGINERLLYNTLKDSKLIESLKALREMDYVARTTERMFRLVRKMQQSTEIELSLAFTKGADHHETCMHKIRVTPVFNQQVSVQSNIIINPDDVNCDVVRSVSSEATSTATTVASEQHSEVETELSVSEPSCHPEIL